jgi:hypothetical protein
MMKLADVCVLAVVVAISLPAVVLSAGSQRASTEDSPFVLADRSGEASANERTFFVFSTRVAKYILRHDGMGEITLHSGVRKVFNVKVGARERIERVYSLEYEGDLLLLYQAGDEGYLVRMNQASRKLRFSGPFNGDFEPPLLKDRRLVFSDGRSVALD